MTDILIKRVNLDLGGDTHRRKMMRRHGEHHVRTEEWGEAPASQGMPKATRSPERGMEQLPCTFKGSMALLLDFRLIELAENKFLSF